MMITVNRRNLVKLGGLACAGVTLSSYPFGWALAGEQPAQPRLVVVLLRGAMDGLNVVIPYGEGGYRAARPTIGLAPPSQPGGVLYLDGHFGLHPALSNLLPLWQNQSLAFVHASGSPDSSRSHFEAQIYMENGTPGVAATKDGWMNRLISVLPGRSGPIRAISLGPTRPHILDGREPNSNFALGPNASRQLPIDRPNVATAFDRLYNGNDVLSSAYHQGKLARSELVGDLEHQDPTADNGAPHPDGFPMVAARLADLLKTDNRIQIAFIDLGGWDTHVGQGAAEGQLANHLKPLGDGLAVLAARLGPEMSNTMVLVMSEFGRTVNENGGGGTDHGHGNVMWVMGGAVAGGRVHGRWPGLDKAALYEGRDLAVTSDFRDAIGLVLERHLRIGDNQLATVFPAAPRRDSRLSSLIRA